jgi:hypothetical protein
MKVGSIHLVQIDRIKLVAALSCANLMHGQSSLIDFATAGTLSWDLALILPPCEAIVRAKIAGTISDGFEIEAHDVPLWRGPFDPETGELSMINGISAVTLGTHKMPRAVRFYQALGFKTLRGGEESSFTSFRAGASS